MSSRVMIAGTGSGCGKTTITCGILNLLKRQGHNAVSLKCGPDYIDPMFHREAIGTSSYNIDSFFLGETALKEHLWEVTKKRDIAVIEGVMGYFDGLAYTVKASSYEVATLTNTPVILVVNGSGMANSICAVIKGFLSYNASTLEIKNNGICGVIVNNVSEKVYENVKEEIALLGVIPCGYVPKLKDCAIESRHLGLMTIDMVDNIKDKLNKLSDVIEQTIDMEKIFEIAGNAGALDDFENENTSGSIVLSTKNSMNKVRIAIAKDEAFSFIYEENIELLENAGLDIMYFSPLHDKTLPTDIGGIILYGGYPEEHLRKLSDNASMLESIRSAADRNVPIIAECGGYMYLKESIEDRDGVAYKMAGVIRGNCNRSSKLVRFGYIELESKQDNLLCDKGMVIKGHEFHYWDSKDNGEGFVAKRSADNSKYDCIHVAENLVAGFPHMYYLSNPKCVERFACAVRKFINK